MTSKYDTLKFYGGPYISLLPAIVFMCVGVLFSVGFHCYAIEAQSIAAVIGLIVTFFLAKNRSEYWKTIITGLTKFGNSKLIFVLFLVGIFTKLLITGHIGQGFVWLSIILKMHGLAFTIMAFLGTTIFALGSGIPFAALFATISIFYVPGILLGANPAILAGAIISGVYFGDALSPCSQLTAATLGLETDSKNNMPADLVVMLRQRIPWISLVGLMTMGLMVIFGHQGGTTHSLTMLSNYSTPLGLLMLIPIIVVDIISIKTKDILSGLTFGIVLGIGIGLTSKIFRFSDVIRINAKSSTPITGILPDGIYSMVDIVLLIVFLYGTVEIMSQSNVITMICKWLMAHHFGNTPRSGEAIIAIGTGIINIFLCGGQLPGILLFGEMSNTIGHLTKLTAERRTYLIISAATTFTGIIPINSVFVMGVINFTAQMHKKMPYLPVPTPNSIFWSTYYSLILTIVCCAWVIWGLGRKIEGDNIN